MSAGYVSHTTPFVKAPKNFGKITDRDKKQRHGLRAPKAFRIDVYEAETFNNFGYRRDAGSSVWLDKRDRALQKPLKYRPTNAQIIKLHGELKAYAEKFVGPCVAKTHEKCKCLKHARICATPDCKTKLRPQQDDLCATCRKREQSRIRMQRMRERKATVPTGVQITITFLPKTQEQVAC